MNTKLFQGYRNIESLDPAELVVSDKQPIDIDAIICKTCKMFALNPQQCINCDSLVCCKCVQRSGDSRNCPTCMINGGRPDSLNNPNVITSEKTQQIINRVTFQCPYACGERNIELMDIQLHILFFCTRAVSENKQEIMGRMYYLKCLLAGNRTKHAERMRNLNERLVKKLQEVKDQHQVLKG